MSSSLEGRRLTALPDAPDYRDRWYEPTLMPLRRALARPEGLVILDQGDEGACTGFGLAAVVNLLHAQQGRDVRVSPRMLYEMAKRHDEWRGYDYVGSSCRGAIKGWFHMGVCRESLWPYRKRAGDLTLARAKDARAHTLGAYYRIRKNIVDMHAALNEAGVVFASATVHAGWDDPRRGRIAPGKRAEGGHAFAIVGYDEEGFLVQNSWGEDWGDGGVALWTYGDWAENVSDAWVVQLALSTPDLYSRRHVTVREEPAGRVQKTAPRRDEIAGHFVHVDDGRFHDEGKYWSTLQDARITAEYVARSDKYDHVLFYAHGGLNSVSASARRIAAMRDTFKDNGIYPYHFMYDTGLAEELRDVVLGKRSMADERAGGLTDWTDRIIEKATRRVGRALWREMKADARDAFARRSSPGSQVLQAFLEAFDADGARPKRIHLVGHSTGAILHAHAIEALARLGRPLRVASVHLLAPACHEDLFARAYLPHLAPGSFGVDRLDVYNLTERLERDDHVAHAYRKSLLYLVSRAFEERVRPPAPILGLQEVSRHWEDRAPGQLAVHYSNGVASSRDRTNATSHGGFDNDPMTMNAVLRTILGTNRPKRPFTADSLDY